MKSFLLISISVLLLASCENIFFDAQPDTARNLSNYYVLWKTMDERYSLFEYKGIDWDSINVVYRPLAENAANETELFYVFSDVLNTLRDGHVNLYSTFDISRFFPYLEAPPNFSFDLLEREYLGDYRITGYLLNQIIDSVGYIYYRSFTLPIADYNLDSVINRFSGLPGVIIDIRNNEGGDPANGLKLASRMIDQRTHIYTSQVKNGPGHDDFSDPEQIYLDPAFGHPHFEGKIVVLTNRKVYSAGSYFSASIKGIPNAILMGDTTGGGCGVPAGHELPNGWYFNFSTSICRTVDGLNFEGGVPPDIFVEFTDEDYVNGVDPIIEAAIEEIKG